MRRFIVPAVTAVLLASTALAHAGKGFYSEEGTVEALDKTAMTLTLGGGEVFHLPDGWNGPEVSENDVVKVIYNIRNRRQKATEIRVLEDN
jgi:hypothetical protein